MLVINAGEDFEHNLHGYCYILPYTAGLILHLFMRTKVRPLELKSLWNCDSRHFVSF
jgi:hypothetical protein